MPDGWKAGFFLSGLALIWVLSVMVGMGIGYHECGNILAQKQSIWTDPVLRK